MIDEIKMLMLNEFEKQIDEIMVFSSENESNFNRVIDLINNQKNSWKLCRVDLQNCGNDLNRIDILDNPNNCHVDFPTWFKDHYGQGCIVQSQVKKVSFKFQCVNEGTVKFNLRGVDYRNPNHLRHPVYINFTTFKVNDELVFDENNLIWHDQPYEFEFGSNDEEIFECYLEFETIFDYYPFFLNLFNNVTNSSDFKREYYLFKKQIQFIHFLEQFGEINNHSLEMYDFMKNDNELILGEDERMLFSYNSFFNHYSSYLNNLEIENKINQLYSKIEFLENKLEDYENILDSNNSLFNTIFLDYTLKPSRLLFNVQTLCLELLEFINKICEKHGIKWWLDYGTLLGSIRHEDFIPWDDDIDIGVMRKDYHKFIEVMFEELEINNLTDYIDVLYRWRKHNGKEVNGTLHFFIRDEKIGKKIILAAVDFFPYDFMRGYDEATFGDSYNRSLRNFYQMLCLGDDTSTVYMGLDYSTIIDNYYDELNLTYDDDKFIIPGVEGAFGYNGTNLYELMVLKHSDVFPLKQSKFKEYIFPVPNDSDFYLKQIYGEDYMKIPKDVRTHNRLTLFRDFPNVNSILEKYIKVLKEANKNFKY